MYLQGNFVCRDQEGFCHFFPLKLVWKALNITFQNCISYLHDQYFHSGYISMENAAWYMKGVTYAWQKNNNVCECMKVKWARAMCKM